MALMALCVLILDSLDLSTSYVQILYVHHLIVGHRDRNGTDAQIEQMHYCNDGPWTNNQSTVRISRINTTAGKGLYTHLPCKKSVGFLRTLLQRWTSGKIRVRSSGTASSSPGAPTITTRVSYWRARRRRRRTHAFLWSLTTMLPFFESHTKNGYLCLLPTMTLTTSATSPRSF